MNRRASTFLAGVSLGFMVAGCGGSSPSAPTPPSTPAPTAVLTVSAPASVAWSAPAAGSTCAAGSVSDFVWTDTISESGGVQVSLTSVVFTIDSAPSSPTAVNIAVPARGQIAASHELCFPTTGGHTVTWQYSGKDANGHSVGTSGTTALVARPISTTEISQLAGSIASVAVPIIYATITQVVAKVQGVSGTYTLDVAQSCSGGGSARSTGPLVVVLDPSGTTGSMTQDTLLTYAKCASGAVVLDSGPLEIKGTMSAVGSVVQNPVNFTITGAHGFSVNGQSGTVTFACNNAMVVDLDAFAVRSLVATGDAKIQYPAGQGSTTVPCQTFADAFGFGKGK
jgi:hypothetical protein